METQLIKPIVKIGNSAGVVLPKAWLNSKAKIELIEESTDDITQKTIQILTEKNLLNETKGIYLSGSYARNEQTSESDIDLLIITNKTNNRITQGKYDLLLVSEEVLNDKLKTNIIPLLPMITEAKPLINKELIENYKKIPLTWKNLKWHIETTKSAMNMNKAAIDLDKELEQEKTGDATAYSLVLRLRGIYIINCIRKNKPWTKKELIKIIKNTTGSTIMYDRYLYVKNDRGKLKDTIPIRQAEDLMNYIKKENIKQEKWLRERRD